MTVLATAIAELIRHKLVQNSDGRAAEVRLIFHGPPLELLDEVFTTLTGDTSALVESVPTVLQLPRLPQGRANPPIGQSGRCDGNHLLNIRNSPSKPTYLALVPPGEHSNRSVSSTSDEFGVGASVNGGNVQFEEWWADEFIQELVSLGVELAGVPSNSRDDARLIVAHAAAAADQVDSERIQRAGAWRVISRLFASAGEVGLQGNVRVSLAAGVPPMGDRSLSARLQTGILGRIADALGDGFGTGIRRIQDDCDEADAKRLDEFLSHLLVRCDRPTAFERATAVFYSPCEGLAVPPVPEWWSALTVEKWGELLAEEADAVGDIVMRCSNSIVSLGKGMPALVEEDVELEFEARGADSDGVVVSIERSPPGPAGKRLGDVTVGPIAFTDVKPPSHRTPLRYTATALGYKPGSLKVISLATWVPGFFVACRLARKLTPPRKATVRRGESGKVDWETSLTVAGVGRYELLVFTSPNVELESEASCASDDGNGEAEENSRLNVRKVRDGQWQVEVEADGNLQVEIRVRRTPLAGKVQLERCRITLSCEEVAEQGCRSEFERLIRANRRVIDPAEARSVVHVDRSERSTSLQDWMLAASSARKSYMPIVLAEDYVEAWVQPDWGEGAGPILSNGKFIQDPRPLPDEFDPPQAFLDAREKIAARVRGEEDQSGLVESAQLGKWLRADDAFRALVESYVDSYQAWLTANPTVACWADVVVVTSLEDAGRTLARVPDAVLLSPLHPLRFAWHCVAQAVLVEADESSKPCPAASVLDPDCIPDILRVSLRSPGGVEDVDFLAVENGTDYWAVLWNGQKLGTLPHRSRLAPFGSGFGISVGGISVGFSAGQVRRALEDVSDLLAAKSIIRVAITSSGGTTDACNDGLISWCSERFQEQELRAPRRAAGPRLLDILDDRDPALRPDDATIANLSEDTRNAVRWFNGQPKDFVPDLGVIAQLDMSEPGTAEVSHRSPLGFGGLLRHRIRRQLPGAFLSESRQSALADGSGDVLADKVAKCVATMENLGPRRTGLRFAPNVNAIREMLETKKTDFVAVSSSAVDPASFLGGWLKGAYLWDYDLPSYSHRAGDTNGYYLLSRVKEADRAALGKSLAKLPGCSAIEPTRIQEMLLEIARRGIPTIRGLAGDDSGATGDLGLFVAVRLLQDRFRLANSGESLLPVFNGTEEDAYVAIVVPVDPFRGYLSDITRTIRKDQKDISQTRPDLLVIGVHLQKDSVRLHLTPIEVKCRPGSAFPGSDIPSALDQAASLSRLLTMMRPSADQPRLWSLGFQHLLLSLVGFGMRVYSQHADVVGQEARWADIHDRIATAILGQEPCVSIDERGRLIIIDDSPRSAAKDHDGDGFQETITIGREEAGKIVGGDPAEFYESVRAKVGDWDLLPKPQRQASRPEASPSPPPSGPALVKSPDPVPPLAAPEPELVPQPPAPGQSETGRVESASASVIVSVGTTIDGFETKALSLNISDTRLNQLNIGVVGDLGTGKTQLLKSLIHQIASAGPMNRGIKPRLLIFDYKRDYSSEEFVRATGARVVKPYRLPLNLFDTGSLGESAAPWLDRFRFFADVLDKVYTGIGPVQRDKLKKAVRSAYESNLAGPPTIYDVHASYSALLDGKSDSPMAIIDDLVDMEVFASRASDIQPFNEFFQGVVVISLDALGQDDRSKNMLVAIMLNMFYENMLKTPKRPFVGADPQLRAIDSYLLVDEADNIMRYEFDVLRKLLLQGREFGTGVILASQYLRHFKVNATDYREPLLTWFIHKVPNVVPAELSALGLPGSAAELAERIKSLKNHQCLYKSFDVAGEIIRGLPFFELVAGGGQKGSGG